jgi:hypothetical protein
MYVPDLQAFKYTVVFDGRMISVTVMGKILFKPLKSMNFIATIFMKLRDVQWHCLVVFVASFMQLEREILK